MTRATSLAGPPVRVLIAYDDKTLFDVLTDPRLEIQRAYDPSRPPQMIVMPCPRLDMAYRQAADIVPPEVWRNAAAVFDGSGEGHQLGGKYLRRLKWFIDARGLAEERCAFVSQNRRLGLRDLNVRVFHYDYWFRRLFSWSQDEGEQMFRQGLERFQSRPTHRAKRFFSLNFTVRREKLLFLLRLIRDGLWDQGYISFAGFRHMAAARGYSLAGIRQDLLETPGFEDLAAELAPLIPELDSKGQVLFGQVAVARDGAGLRKPLASMTFEEFDRSWFSAVVETEMGVKLDRLTEKSFKALLNFHPQVVLGNHRALARLRAFGFETFAPEIDETYDQEADPRRRFELAYAEIVRLARLDEAELEAMERRLADVLVANARWGLIEFPEQYRRHWDPAIVTELLSLIPPKA